MARAMSIAAVVPITRPIAASMAAGLRRSLEPARNGPQRAKSGAERLRGFLSMIPPSKRWRAASTAVVHPMEAPKQTSLHEESSLCPADSGFPQQAECTMTSETAERLAELLCDTDVASDAHASESLLGRRCVQLEDDGCVAASVEARFTQVQGTLSPLLEARSSELARAERSDVRAAEPAEGEPAGGAASAVAPSSGPRDAGLLLQRLASLESAPCSTADRDGRGAPQLQPSASGGEPDTRPGVAGRRSSRRRNAGPDDQPGGGQRSLSSSTDATSGSRQVSPPVVSGRDRDSVRFSVGGSLWHPGAAASSSSSGGSSDAEQGRCASHADAGPSDRLCNVWQRKLPPLNHLATGGCAEALAEVPEQRESCTSRGSRIRFSDVEPRALVLAGEAQGSGQPHDRSASGSGWSGEVRNPYVCLANAHAALLGRLCS